MELNQIIIAGNLTRDPELKYLQNEMCVAKLGLACNRKYKGEEKVTFVDVEAWGKTAELCGQYLAKGREVVVVGRLEMDSWESDGKRRTKLKVVAERVQFVGGGERKDRPAAGGGGQVQGVPVDDEDGAPF